MKKDTVAFCFDIKESLCVLREGSYGWNKELNIVSWNDGDPKYDIRDWSPDHERMSRGVVLTKGEMADLVAALEARLKKPFPGDKCLHESWEGDIHIRVYESLCKLTTNAQGWQKEATITSWNDGEPKVDIRFWAPGYGRMARGVTLTQAEARTLVEAMKS